MRRLLAADEFARLAGESGNVAEAGVYRFATSTADLTNVEGRAIPYVLSDSSVARDTHTIDQNGWKLDNFLRNPVFLWAHDDSGLPIGKMTDIGVIGGKLRGVVEYAQRDLYPFADTVFQMVKQGFLNAVSTAWLPLDWKFSTDKSRIGGIDFIRQELLEVSQVPIPALATALAEARSAGIDTGPMFEWAEKILDGGGLIMVPRADVEQWRREAKMPASKKKRSEKPEWKSDAARDLPIDEKSEWDGAAAKASIFDAFGFDGDNPDSEKARKAFLVYDAANPKLKGSYKLPFARIEDGKMIAVAAGLRNAASRLPQTEGLPDNVAKEARDVLDAYEKKMGDTKKAQAIRSKFARGLYEVGNLAWVLEQLSWIEDCVEFEADIEQDGSDIPARLTDVLNTVGLILIDMTKEEVSELLAVEAEEDGGQIEAIEQAAKTDGQKILAGVLRMAKSVCRLRSGNLAVETRAGKVISASNMDKLTRAMEHHRAMGDLMQDVMTSAKPDDTDDDAERAAAADIRKREVELLEILNPAA